MSGRAPSSAPPPPVVRSSKGVLKSSGVYEATRTGITGIRGADAPRRRFSRRADATARDRVAVARLNLRSGWQVARESRERGPEAGSRGGGSSVASSARSESSRGSRGRSSRYGVAPPAPPASLRASPIRSPRGGVGTSIGKLDARGMYAHVEGSGPDFVIFTWEPTPQAEPHLANGRFNLRCTLRVPKPGGAGSDAEHRGFHLVFGYRGPRDYYVVSHSLHTHMWKLEAHFAGQAPLCLESLPMSLGKTLSFELLLQVRGNSVSLDANDEPIFTSVKHGRGLTMAGGAGVAAYRCRYVVREWAVWAYNEPAPSEGGTFGGGPPSGQVAVQRRPTRVLEADEDCEGGGAASVSAASASTSATVRRRGDPAAGLPPRPAEAIGPTVTRGGYYDPGMFVTPSSIDPNTGPDDADHDGAQSDSDGVVAVNGGSGGAGAAVSHEASDSTSGRGAGPASDTPKPYHRLPPYQGDDPSLIESIRSDMLEVELNVRWDDIAELETAKRLLNESVVLPLLVPDLFTGIREPWRGVLLFGPPGTGKTMLAKAAASVKGVTFFNCSAASLISKWRGESEKLVRCLFDMAHYYAPSIVFIDEIDSMLGKRGGASEHEASRRFKTMLLTMMDGLTSRAAGTSVMVLATSNTPWDLDEALRRRFEKRIYIPLPDLFGREKQFQLNLAGCPTADDVDVEELADATRGYSGADIRIVCREASMKGMRRLLASKSIEDIRAARAAGALEAPPISMADLSESIEATKPSVAETDLVKFEIWEREFGSA